MVTVSRSDVPAYEDEREEVEELVAAINGKHRRADGSEPLCYLDRSLDEQQLAAWFRAADALVVTSLADGMKPRKPTVAMCGNARTLGLHP